MLLAALPVHLPDPLRVLYAIVPGEGRWSAEVTIVAGSVRFEIRRVVFRRQEGR